MDNKINTILTTTPDLTIIEIMTIMSQIEGE